MASSPADKSKASDPNGGVDVTSKAGEEDSSVLSAFKLRSQVKDVKKQVFGKVHDAAGSASAMVNKFRDKVEAYAEKASDKISASASDIQQNLTRSLNFPLSTGASHDQSSTKLSSGAGKSSSQQATGPASGAVTSSGHPVQEGSNDEAAPGFPMSIFTWCSSLCGGGSKNSTDRGFDPSLLQSNDFLKNIAGNVSTAISDASQKLEEQAQQAKKAAEAQVENVSKVATDHLDAIAKETEEYQQPLQHLSLPVRVPQ